MAAATAARHTAITEPDQEAAVVVTAPPVSADPAGAGPLIALRVKVGLIGCLLALFGFICYGIGTAHGSRFPAHVAVGRAYVSPAQVGVRVGGWSYGFELSENGLTWYDSRGVRHDGGLPSCLRNGPRHTWIRFGWSTAIGPGGEQWRSVTWVQCTGHP